MSNPLKNPSMGSYQVIRILKLTPTSETNLVRDIQNGHMFVLKNIPPVIPSEYSKFKTFTSLKHPNIIQFSTSYPITMTSDYTQIPLPYYFNGSLSTIFNKQKYGISINGWDSRQQSIFCYKLACALAYLHSKGIFHGHLKPSNILISNDFEPIVTDYWNGSIYGYKPPTDINFGQFQTDSLNNSNSNSNNSNNLNSKFNAKQSSKLKSKSKGKSSSNSKNNQEFQEFQEFPEYLKEDIIYSPPELYTGSLSYSSDTYTFGLIIYSLLFGQPTPVRDLLFQNPFPGDLSDLYSRFIERCLANVPSSRPDMTIIPDLFLQDNFIFPGVDSNLFNKYKNNHNYNNYNNNLYIDKDYYKYHKEIKFSIKINSSKSKSLLLNYPDQIIEYYKKKVDSLINESEKNNIYEGIINLICGLYLPIDSNMNISYFQRAAHFQIPEAEFM